VPLPKFVPNFSVRQPSRQGAVVPRSALVKLKVHRASRRLYKSVGRSLGRTGVPKPRVFYFDPASPDLAVQCVVELKNAWKKL
jgi:hypothetical protein